MKRSRFGWIGLLELLFLMLASFGYGQIPLTWNGGTSGNWDLITVDWLNGATPTTWIQNDTALFNTPSSITATIPSSVSVINVFDIVVVNSNVTIAAQSSSTAFDIAGDVSTSNGSLTFGPNLVATLTAPSLVSNFSGNFIIDQTAKIQVTPSTLTVVADTTIDNSGTIEGVVSVAIEGSAGTLTINNSATGVIDSVLSAILLHNGATITNANGGTIQSLAAGDGIALTNGFLTVDNDGEINGAVSGIAFSDGASINNGAAGVIIGASSNGITAAGSSIDIVNSGSIAAGIGNAINMADAGTITNNNVITNTSNANSTIVLANGGNITNAIGATIINNGISGGGGISATGGFLTLNNGGTVASPSDAIVLAAGGNISNGSAGNIVSAFGNGINLQAGALTLSNENSITGVTSGVLVNGAAQVTNLAPGGIGGVVGINVQGGSLSLSNSGSVQGTTDSGIKANVNINVTNEVGGTISGGALIEPTGIGINMLAGSLTLDNFGTIEGVTSAISLAAGGSITNEVGGVITFFATGTPIAIISSGGNTAISNASLINGSIELASSVNAVTLFTGSQIVGDLNIGTNAGSQLILDGTGTQTYSGAVTGATTFLGVLTKQNVGTWILDQSLANVIQTNVTGGTLLANSILGGNTTVFSGAAFGGNGSNTGSVTVNSGATLLGQSTSTFTVGSLTLQSGSISSFALGPPSTTPLFVVQGNLTTDGLLLISDAGGFGFGTYRLMNYGGTLTNNGYTITSVPPGFNPGDFSLDTTTPGQVNLVVSPPAGPNGISLQYWDGPDTAPIGRVNGGTGVWNSALTDWTNASGTINGPWSRGGAVFTAQNGTVMLGDNVAFRGLFFLTNGYTITSPSGFALVPLGNALIQVVGNATATINAPLVGSGTITKFDAGTLNLTGGSPSSIGGMVIQGGKVLVNTVLNSPMVTVQPAGTLGGNGIIVGNVTNSGTVAPGNSVGKLTINGSYTQNGSGIFQLEIANLNSFDQLVVNGPANLDGTLQVVTLGGWQLAAGQQYTFLKADSINGLFSTITGIPDGLKGLLVESGDPTLTLLIGLPSYTLVPNLTQNELNVAQALDQCFIDTTSGDKFDVNVALAMLPLSDYGAAFDQIGPGYYESFANTLIEQANALGQFFLQQFSAVRLGNRGFSAIGMEAPIIVENTGKNYIGTNYKENKDILVNTPENKWGVWIQGNGIFARNRSVNSVPSYQFASGGFVGGADYKWFEGLATGLFAGYQGTYSKYQNRGRTIINGVNFGGYATYDAPDNGFYADGFVGGNFSQFNVRRPLKFSTIDRIARSRPDSGGVTTLLATGYDVEMSNFTVGPVIAGQYTYTGIGAFTESGADSLNLKVRQQNANSLRTSVGGRIAYTWNIADKILIIPEGRMFWQHEFLQYPRTISSALDAGACPMFAYSTASPNRDAVFAAAGLIVQLGQHVNLNAYYNADFGRKDHTSHMVSGGVNVGF